MRQSFLLAPSLLSANFADLSSSIKMITEKGGDVIHIDVMDGHFVPNLTFGPLVVKAIRPLTSKPFDVHLMVTNPADYIDAFVDAGADFITFHIEAHTHAHKLITSIKEKGCKAGISLVPSTPISILSEILPIVDVVLVMSVNPGFGGQTLIPSCLEKVRHLKKIKQENAFQYIVSIDGGVNSATLQSVVDAGAELIVSGSAFFSGELVVPK